jgi:hypothetical protein
MTSHATFVRQRAEAPLGVPAAFPAREGEETGEEEILLQTEESDLRGRQIGKYDHGKVQQSLGTHALHEQHA